MKTIKFEDYDVNGQRIDDLEMDLDDVFEQITNLQDRCEKLEKRESELVEQIKYLNNRVDILTKILKVKIIKI